LAGERWNRRRVVESLRKERRAGIWQRRFFEHKVKGDADLKRCVDYVHVNPLKHQLVDRLRTWPWSSFHRYVWLGEYDSDWDIADLWFGDEFEDAE
tara:strand:- start:25294 stop:25581 length:288 start_codon:yes stop_codon:yes gene_type:complete